MIEQEFTIDDFLNHKVAVKCEPDDVEWKKFMMYLEIDHQLRWNAGELPTQYEAQYGYYLYVRENGRICMSAYPSDDGLTTCPFEDLIWQQQPDINMDMFTMLIGG